MQIDDMTALVSLILALSAASERLVAIVKGAVPFLNTPQTDPSRERWRVLSLRLLAVASGVVTALLSSEFLLSQSYSWPAIVGLGLLSAGGSDLWNSILGYLNGVKDVQKNKGEVAKAETAALRNA